MPREGGIGGVSRDGLCPAAPCLSFPTVLGLGRGGDASPPSPPHLGYQNRSPGVPPACLHPAWEGAAPPLSPPTGSPWGGGFVRVKSQGDTPSQPPPGEGLCPNWGKLGSCRRVKGLVAKLCHQESVAASGRDPPSAWASSKDAAAALVLRLGPTPAPTLPEGSRKRSENPPGVHNRSSRQTFSEPPPLHPQGLGAGSA